MTREEAINEIKQIQCFDKPFDNSVEECNKFAKREIALNMAINALEQDPILDKIRAEIEQAADKQFQIAMGVSDLNERYAHIRMENAYRHSLNIINKYKAESEVEE